jgi:uncharacterized protein (TIGR03437 family)
MSKLSKVALLAAVVAVRSLAQPAGSPVSTVPSGTLVPAPGSPYITGPQSTSIASGDFNGDGLPDLVVASTGQAATLTILLATPSGGFVPAPAGPITIPLVAYSNNVLAVADFNGDGKLDIAFLAEKGLEILLGDGHGGFSPGPTSPITLSSFGFDNADAIGVGDFNHDNKPDLAIADLDSTGPVAILLGDGTGNFIRAPGSPPHTGQTAQVLTVADFNMDGNLDVAVTNTGLNQVNQVAVLLGDGTGQLTIDTKGPFPTGEVPTAIARGDFDADGKEDLAVVNWFAATITILLGDGTGGFTRPADLVLPGGARPQWIAVGDIDGDGLLDLVVAANGNPPIGGLYILLGDGKGGFEIATSGPFDVPGGLLAVTLADFNGDGRLDVAITNLEGTASVFLGSQASSSFTLTTSSGPTVGVPFSVTALVNSTGFRTPTGRVIVRDGSNVVGTGDLSDGSVTFQTTASTAGSHSLAGVYQGDLRTNSSATELTINVAQGSQTISFPTLPAHAYDDPPFSVPASSSSGLRVTVSVISGPATIAGNVLTLTGAGVVTLQASQLGDANYLPATPVQQQLQVAAPSLRINAVLNAASYSTGPFGPGSLVVVFGADLLPEPGTSIAIIDTSGKVSSTLPYFASPAQINFILPPDLNHGNATLTVRTQTGPSATAPISIAAVGPGLFSADASGKGVAAGSALRVSTGSEQTVLPISSCAGQPPVCAAIPIDLGTASDTVYLTLYGTGIRGRSALANVTATIGGIATNVLYAGAQPAYPGLDQVNLTLSSKLRGQGSVGVILTVDGVAANVVTVTIQ